MPLPANLLTVAEVKIFGKMASGGSTTKNTVNTLHFRRTSVVNPISEVHIDTAFQAAIAAKVLLALNNRWAQTFNTVRLINDPTRVPVQVSHANPGAVAGDSMPSFNYAYTLIRSQFRGKSFKGNLKLGPLSESNTTAGTDDILNAGAITLFGNVGAAILAGFTDADGNVWVSVVFSRTLSNLTIIPAAIVTTVDTVSTLLNKRIGRMKRRESSSAY